MKKIFLGVLVFALLSIMVSAAVDLKNYNGIETSPVTGTKCVRFAEYSEDIRAYVDIIKGREVINPKVPFEFCISKIGSEDLKIKVILFNKQVSKTFIKMARGNRALYGKFTLDAETYAQLKKEIASKKASSNIQVAIFVLPPDGKYTIAKLEPPSDGMGRALWPSMITKTVTDSVQKGIRETLTFNAQAQIMVSKLPSQLYVRGSENWFNQQFQGRPVYTESDARAASRVDTQGERRLVCDISLTATATISATDQNPIIKSQVLKFSVGSPSSYLIRNTNEVNRLTCTVYDYYGGQYVQKKLYLLRDDFNQIISGKNTISSLSWVRPVSVTAGLDGSKVILTPNGFSPISWSRSDFEAKGDDAHASFDESCKIEKNPPAGYIYYYNKKEEWGIKLTPVLSSCQGSSSFANPKNVYFEFKINGKFGVKSMSELTGAVR